MNQEMTKDMPDMPSGGLTFSAALFALKEGYRITRKGWNGKGMFLIYVPGTIGATPFGAYKKALNDDSVDILPHIDMYTAQGNMQPGWLASQSDILADDWVIID